MPDSVDRAQEQEEEFLAMAIDAARGIPAPAVTVTHHCLECGVEIPEPRRRAAPGCQLCIDCAVEFEGKALRGLL